MNAIIFLCGAGVGALIATIILLVLISVMANNMKKVNKESNQHGRNVLDALQERNRLTAEANEQLCGIRNSLR